VALLTSFSSYKLGVDFLALRDEIFDARNLGVDVQDECRLRAPLTICAVINHSVAEPIFANEVCFFGGQFHAGVDNVDDVANQGPALGSLQLQFLIFAGAGWLEWPEQESSAWVRLASYTAVLFGEKLC
jgi:hypothetical protein